MRDYREKVRRLARERTGEAFFNASEEHATIIAENMFRAAEREVCIFTRHLAPRIYGREHTVEWAKIFLSDDQEHKLRVVVREGDRAALGTNPLFVAVKGSPNVNVRALSDTMHDGIAQTFMVADGDSYRFEPDKTECKAVAAFNSPEASKLQGVFEDIWRMSQPVDLDNLRTLHSSLVN